MRNLRDTYLSRRGLLTGCAVLLAATAGCTTGAPKTPPAATPDPLKTLFDEHVALQAAYDDAIAAAPQDARLAPLRENAVQHVTALAGALAIAVPRAPTSGSTSGPASSAPPPDPSMLVPSLAQTETTLAAACRNFAISAKVERAPLLASMAAAHSLAAKVLA